MDKHLLFFSSAVCVKLRFFQLEGDAKAQAAQGGRLRRCPVSPARCKPHGDTGRLDNHSCGAEREVVEILPAVLKPQRGAAVYFCPSPPRRVEVLLPRSRARTQSWLQSAVRGKNRKGVREQGPEFVFLGNVGVWDGQGL